MNKISENIKKIRLEKNLTQQEVADKLYVTRQCISRWEQGLTLPDIDNIERLAQVFNCNKNDIIDNDSIKTITIVEAIKNKRTKKIIITGILISVLAILVSLVSIFLLDKNIKNYEKKDLEIKEEIKEEKNKVIKYLRAIVLDKNTDGIKFKLDKEQVPIERYRDFTLTLKEVSTIKVYDNFQKQIDLNELKIKDIVELSYYNELNTKNLFEINLIDSEVEKSFYGVIVVTNGQRYETYEDIPTDGTKGIRYYLHEKKWNSSSSRNNAGLFEASNNFTYEQHNGHVINCKYDFEMNIYFDKFKLSEDPVIGLVYSTGIEYVETIDRNYNTSREYEGEQGYAHPEGIYLNHSVYLKFKIHFNMLSSINKLEIYEYDMNNELIQMSTLNENDFFLDFSPHKDTLYAYFKEYSTSKSGLYETFITYKLNVGEKVMIPKSDEHGLIWKENFVYSR